MEDLPQKFNFDEILQKYHYSLLILLVGLILIVVRIIFFKNELKCHLNKSRSLAGDYRRLRWWFNYRRDFGISVINRGFINYRTAVE
jgi:hypothetical protein